jgi:hypothetical protein
MFKIMPFSSFTPHLLAFSAGYRAETMRDVSSFGSAFGGWLFPQVFQIMKNKSNVFRLYVIVISRYGLWKANLLELTFFISYFFLGKKVGKKPRLFFSCYFFLSQKSNQKDKAKKSSAAPHWKLSVFTLPLSIRASLAHNFKTFTKCLKLCPFLVSPLNCSLFRRANARKQCETFLALCLPSAVGCFIYWANFEK